MPFLAALPTVGADDAAVGTGVWMTPANITADDAATAQINNVNNLEVTHYLKGTGLGFAVPSDATIDGIVLEVERRATGSGSATTDSSVRLLKAGSPTGQNKASGAVWPTTDGTATYGSPTDLWGTTWTPAEVNAGDFGAVLSATNPSAANAALRVDFLRVTVHYTEAVIPPPNPAQEFDFPVGTELEVTDEGLHVTVPGGE